MYVEYSNEVWNRDLPQRDHALRQGQARALPGKSKDWSYYVYASVRLFEAFEAVFGKDNPRLVRVLSGQAGWTGPCEGHMTALADATINPNGTKPDVYAIAPTSPAPRSTSCAPRSRDEDLDRGPPRLRRENNGLSVISYEGGSDSFSGPCTALQVDPEMHDLYTAYLDAMLTAGTEGSLHAVHSLRRLLGLKAKTSDSIESSPKYRGILDWLAPRP